ncbi:MAG: helix-turn-helix transcriptional regulator [Oscillospiraceae bacterium]|nr:helix-turn-helix transcriptional regulator [Oscillospiraceae bacterium]
MFAAVFVNLGVWLIEQLVKLDFEFLSISYIISELFLLGLHKILQEKSKTVETASSVPEVVQTEPEPVEDTEQHSYFCEQIKTLTPTEHRVFTLYLSGKTTKEVLEELNIKENTLKFHNKNIYSKLGVSSRKQLLQIARTMKTD